MELNSNPTKVAWILRKTLQNRKKRNEKRVLLHPNRKNRSRFQSCSAALQKSRKWRVISEVAVSHSKIAKKKRVRTPLSDSGIVY